MYKSLRPQPCLVHYPVLGFRGQVPRSLYLSFFPCYLLLTSLGRSESYTLSSHPCRDDLQIIHCSLNPRLDDLRQCCCHCSCSSVAPWPRCTRRTLLTSDLGFAREDYGPAFASHRVRAPSDPLFFWSIIGGTPSAFATATSTASDPNPTN